MAAPEADLDVLDTRLTRPDPVETAPVEPAPAPRYGICRAALLLVLVLGLQLGFVAAFIGALHGAPDDGLPVAVVRGDMAVAKVAAQAGATTTPTEEFSDRQSALQAVLDRRAYAALVPDGTGGAELLIATASTEPTAQALTRTYSAAARAAGVRTTIFDGYSPRAATPRNLATFYLVVGWVSGGFLAATALAIALGAVPASERRTQARVLALLAFSIVSGIAGAALVGPSLDGGAGYGLGLATFGAMIAFGAAMTAAALQGWFGLIGAGAAIGLFLLLGNPGSSSEYLPAFLDGPHTWALTGVGTQLVRSAISVDESGGAQDLVALWLYCFGGAVAFLIAGHVRPGRRRARLTNS